MSEHTVNPGQPKAGPHDFELLKLLGKGGYGKVGSQFFQHLHCTDDVFIAYPSSLLSFENKYCMIGDKEIVIRSITVFTSLVQLQCSDAVGWVTGRASGL